MNEDILARISKLIWFSGAAVFIYLSWPYMWGTITYLFSFLSSLVSDSQPSPSSVLAAKEAISNLFPILVLCFASQLLVFATPFLITGSKSLIAYYNAREQEHIDALSDRLKLAEQITRAKTELRILSADIHKIHDQISQISRETNELGEAVQLSRKSLNEEISPKAVLSDKGDF